MIPGLILKLLTNRYTLGLISIILVFSYITYLRHNIKSLEKDNEHLSILVDQQKLIINNLKKDIEDISKIKDDFFKEREKLIKEKNNLEKTLNRQNSKKKTLEELATKKTTLIEKKINKATKEVFKCFEAISDNKEC